MKANRNTRGRSLPLVGAFILLFALWGTSCARIYPPAGPPAGPRPTTELQPPEAVHGLAAQGQCLACHGKDERFVASLQSSHPVPVPPGFQGSLQEACQLCHAMEQSHTLARAMPHPVEGWEACFACHASGVATAPQTPPNHSGYSITKCNVCHAPASPAQPLPTPAATPEPTQPAATTTPAAPPLGPALPTPEPTPTPSPEPGKVASPVPHSLAGKEDCLACHGAGGFLPMTSDHVGRDNQTCALCH